MATHCWVAWPLPDCFCSTARFCHIEDLRPDPRRCLPLRLLVVVSGDRICCRLRTLGTTRAWQELDLANASCRGGRAGGNGGVGVAAHIRQLSVHVHRRGSGGRGNSIVHSTISKLGALDAEHTLEREHIQRLVDPLRSKDHDLGD